MFNRRFLRDRRDRLLGAERAPSTDATHVTLAITPLFLALHVCSHTTTIEYLLLWERGICDYAYTLYLMKPLMASVVPSSTKSQSHSQSHRLMGVIVMTVKFHSTFPRVNLRGRLGKKPDLVSVIQ